MEETRRKFDQDFQRGAVRLVLETGKPIAEAARALGVKAGALGHWVSPERRVHEQGNGALAEDERTELVRLRRENAELRMQRTSSNPPLGSRGDGRLAVAAHIAVQRAKRACAVRPELPGAGGVAGAWF